MNKRQRAFASMILTWVLIVGIPTTLITISIFAKGRLIGSGETDMIDVANSLASLIFVIIELCLIAIALVALHHYFRYYRSSVFIFKGFSNAAKLGDIDQIPVDLNNLAREELAYQFRLVYEKLKKHYVESNDRENACDFAHQSSDDQEKCDTRLSDLYAEEVRPEDKDVWPLPNTEFQRSILNTRKADLLVNYLKKTMELTKTGDLSDLVSAIERTAPERIAPVVSLMDMIFPARAITVTCHLQWRGNCSSGIGITFEVTDSKKKGGVSFTQTLWLDRTILTKEGKKLTEYYIELLKPAMRWLVLLYWEREIWLDVSNDDKKGFSMLLHQLVATLGIFNNDKEGLRRAFLYLLGELCYVSADHFSVCSNFFAQQAICRLCKVTSGYPNYSLPYFMRGAIYDYEVGRAQEGSECSCSLCRQAIYYYNKALDDLQWSGSENHSQDFKNLITILRALAIIDLKDEKLLNDTIEQIDNMIEEKGNPITFYSDDGREGCSHYLSNLASWYYYLAEEKYKSSSEVENKKKARTKARHYLIYSFVRNPPSWYSEEQEERRRKGFNYFFDEKFGEFRSRPFRKDELKKLWVILEENPWEIFALARQKTEAFYYGVKTLFGCLWEQELIQEAETGDANKQYEYTKSLFENYAEVASPQR